MRRLCYALAAVGLLLAILAPAASAGGPKKDNDTYVQLLAINDFHGNLRRTRRDDQVDCCEFDVNRRRTTADAGAAPRAASSTSATLVKAAAATATRTRSPSARAT